MKTLLNQARIIQNAYVVPDIQEAMRDWNSTFGIGPFMLIEHVPTEDMQYRGQSVSMDFSIALVQSGDMNIELIEQHDDTPSAYRDMYSSTEQGFHHIAMIADDFEGEIRNFKEAGYPVANGFLTGPDSGVVYIDTRPLLGHFVELYQNRTAIEGLYAVVRSAAENWDGTTLIAGP
jgi:hypothetical protein